MVDQYGKVFWGYINDTSLSARCVVGAISLYTFYRLVIKKRYRLPPGPRSWPLIGNLTALRTKTLLEAVNDWEKEYGDIITVNLGPMRTIVISDIDKVVEAFVTKSSEFSDRTYFYSLDLLSEGGKSIVTASLGDTWKYQRKVASQSLRQYLTGHQFEERCHEVLVQVAGLIESKQEPFLLSEVLSLCVFNVLHGLCFGTTLEFDDPGFTKMSTFVNDFNKDAGNGFFEDVFPPLRYWPTKRFKEMAAKLKWFIDYIHQRVTERKAEIDKASPRCLTDSVLLAQQEIIEADSAASVHMTDVHTRQILADVFGAGVDTSRSTLDWIFLVLVAYPDIQGHIHKEIDEVVGEKIPGKEHRAKLVYTEAVILETMRLYAVAPLGVFHESRSDTVVGGYEIPAKTNIMVNQHLILRDPKHWDDPLVFKPERFMNEDGTKLSVRNRSFIPFSTGPRSCPGESLAKLEIVYLVVGLLQKFSFSLPAGEKAEFTPDSSFVGFRAPNFKVIAHSR